MAEKDIVGGIFGLTPEMYQRGLAAKDTATNLAAAQLTPGQLAGYYAMEAGSGLGRAVPGLLGVEDPQLEAIRGAQSLLGEFDISTSAGLRGLTVALQQKAKETGNSAYMGMANDASKKYKETLLNEANVYQKSGENINTLIASGKFTPESLGVYAKTRNPKDLEYIDKGLSGANLEKVASAEKANESLSLGNADIDGFLKDLKENKVVYGPVSNLSAKGSAAFGSPTDNALKQQEIESFITGSINDVLNSAKGVQAKDDALRAERQIKGYLAMNSNEGVKKALERLKKVKEDTIKSNETYINVLTKGKGTGTTTTKTSTSGQYADDYAKYKQKYGNQALPYEAYVRKRSGQ